MALIVLIEDTPESARMAEKLLKRAGHDVVWSAEGESGLNMVFERQPALVLIDLGLPDMDGQTVVALIRQNPATEHTRIIAFTAWPEDRAREMATAYGCDGVIIKPLDTRAFATQVQAFLDS